MIIEIEDLKPYLEGKILIDEKELKEIRGGLAINLPCRLEIARFIEIILDEKSVITMGVKMPKEVSEGYDGRDAVDPTGGFDPTQDAGQELRPGHVGEFEHHAGQGQPHETQDHKQVCDALFKGKTLDEVTFVLVFLFRLPFDLQVFPGTREPQDGVQAEKAEYAK